jgi:hypothetical protein
MDNHRVVGSILATLSLVSLCYGLPVLASDPSVGTATFNFLKITSGARFAGLAEVGLGLSGDAACLHHNPAGLASLSVPRISTSYCHYVAGIHTGELSYARPYSPGSAWALGVAFLNAGTMEKMDEFGESQGEFGSTGLAMAFGYARQFSEDLTVGGAVKGIYQGIDEYQAHGVAVDVGVQYQIDPYPVVIAGVIQNLGVQTGSFGDEKEDLPLRIRAGGLYRILEEKVSVGLDLEKAIDNKFLARVGAEWWASEQLALRMGYSSSGSDLKTESGGDVLAGFSFGMGLLWQRYAVDYAVTPMVDLGWVHRIGFGLGWL